MSAAPNLCPQCSRPEHSSRTERGTRLSICGNGHGWPTPEAEIPTHYGGLGLFKQTWPTDQPLPSVGSTREVSVPFQVDDYGRRHCDEPDCPVCRAASVRGWTSIGVDIARSGHDQTLVLCYEGDMIVMREHLGPPAPGVLEVALVIQRLGEEWESKTGRRRSLLPIRINRNGIGDALFDMLRGLYKVELESVRSINEREGSVSFRDGNIFVQGRKTFLGLPVRINPYVPQGELWMRLPEGCVESCNQVLTTPPRVLLILGGQSPIELDTERVMEADARMSMTFSLPTCPKEEHHA